VRGILYLYEGVEKVERVYRYNHVKNQYRYSLTKTLFRHFAESAPNSIKAFGFLDVYFQHFQAGYLKQYPAAPVSGD